MHSSDAQDHSLQAYLALLQKWNRAYNLTAIRDPAKMASLHLQDSLSVAPYLHGQRVLDVGTGAGLPGVPLAITHADKDFVLLDSNSKKIRFLHQVRLELGLENIKPVQSRIEDFDDDRGFDVILSRAFATLSDMLTGVGHLLSKETRVLAMKGRYPVQELQALGTDYHSETIKLDVPGIDAERHLVVIRQS